MAHILNPKPLVRHCAQHPTGPHLILHGAFWCRFRKGYLAHKAHSCRLWKLSHSLSNTDHTAGTNLGNWQMLCPLPIPTLQKRKSRRRGHWSAPWNVSGQNWSPGLTSKPRTLLPWAHLSVPGPWGVHLLPKAGTEPWAPWGRRSLSAGDSAFGESWGTGLSGQRWGSLFWWSLWLF